MKIKIELDTTKSIFENINDYFTKAKKLKEKLKKIDNYIEEIKRRLDKIEQQITEEKIKLERKKNKKWYEKFRWFFTSNNFLLIAGKDALSNEYIIKKYLGQKDLVFHADIHGSPFGILKNGQEAPKEDILEAAQFIGSYSRAWKLGLSSIEVYYVLPSQVSKKAPSGEFLSKGSFMIYGNKNYLRVKLEIAIGIKENELIPGVPSSVSKKTSKYVILVPGNKKPQEIAKEISDFFGYPLDEIIQFIPGESEIFKKFSKEI